MKIDNLEAVQHIVDKLARDMIAAMQVVRSANAAAECGIAELDTRAVCDEGDKMLNPFGLRIGGITHGGDLRGMFSLTIRRATDYACLGESCEFEYFCD